MHEYPQQVVVAIKAIRMINVMEKTWLEDLEVQDFASCRILVDQAGCTVVYILDSLFRMQYNLIFATK